MDGLLSILEQRQQLLEECIDEQKPRFVASKVSFWDYFGIPQAHYLALDKTEKSRTLGEYYNKLVLQYFGSKNLFYFVLHFILNSGLASGGWFSRLSDLIFFWQFRETFLIW